eukprot:13487044-Heterocapsa_arctica.AAC.1
MYISNYNEIGVQVLKSQECIIMQQKLTNLRPTSKHTDCGRDQGCKQLTRETNEDACDEECKGEKDGPVGGVSLFSKIVLAMIVMSAYLHRPKQCI